MSQLSINLGNGKTGIIELDTFTRILTDQIHDNEEIRRAWEIGFEYVGIASSGSSPSDAVWQIVRCTWENGQKVRIQFKSDISWDQRALNWA